MNVMAVQATLCKIMHTISEKVNKKFDIKNNLLLKNLSDIKRTKIFYHNYIFSYKHIQQLIIPKLQYTYKHNTKPTNKDHFQSNDIQINIQTEII